MAGAEAQAGFYYQNLVAAMRLLDLIEIGSEVKSVTLENPGRAKHIDDIIVDGDLGPRFIQVKWSGDEETSFTLSNLIASDDGGSLWEKLAIGFEKVRHEPGDVIVELLSTRRAGVNRQAPQGFPCSLQEFLTNFHIPFTKTPAGTDVRSFESYQSYKEVVNRLYLASGLPDIQTYSAFLRAIRFNLSQDSRNTVEARLRARLRGLGIEQMQYGTLLDNCIKWSISGLKVDRLELLQTLGLTDRFSERLKNHFPVEEPLWVPTPDLFSRIDEAISRIKTGFVVVLGEPGAGKSTAITKYLSETDAVRFGYYCFIPDESAIGNERLQEDAFVRSICVGLRDAFPDFSFTTPYAYPSTDLLNKWLSELSKENQRVVFMVDGLDHVDRKTKQHLLSKPLTSVLDGKLPSNILVLLTTRHEGAIPPSIRDELQRDPERMIRIDRFDIDQVRQFMRLRGLDVDESLLSDVLEVSGGVPIYLQYLSAKLATLPVEDRKGYLQSAPSLRGREIDHFHSCMWQEWSSDADLVYLFAVLAVRDEYTSLEVIHDLMQRVGHQVSMATLSQKIKSVAYVLRASEAKGFGIIHASLVEYVSQSTEDLRKEITSAIVEWYADNPSSDEAWRNRFRHLYDLSEYAKIISACDDEWVNTAWANYRPIEEIKSNLDICWRASIISRDLLAFFRIGFLVQQIGLIEFNISATSSGIALLLLDMGLTDVSLNTIWNGERCLESPYEMAKYANHYRQRIGRTLPSSILAQIYAGRSGADPQQADEIFRAAMPILDPFDLLAEAGSLRWTQSAGQSHLIQKFGKEESDEINLGIQVSIIKELSVQGQIDSLYKLIANEELAECLLPIVALGLLVALADGGFEKDAVALIGKHSFDKVPSSFFDWALIRAANRGIVITPSRAEALPSIPKFEASIAEGRADFQSFFDRIRAHILGQPDFKSIGLRALVHTLDWPMSSVLLALVDLAEMWAGKMVGSNKAVSPRQLIEICRTLARRPIGQSRIENSDALSDYKYEQMFPIFFGCVWGVAQSTLDDEGIIELAADWLRLDSGSASRRFVAATRDLTIVLASRRAVASQNVVDELLAILEGGARTEEETGSLTSALVDVARDMGVCGRQAGAVRIWTDICTAACGIHNRKDYQFNEVLLPLRMAHMQDPDGSRGRLADQLKLAHCLEEAGSGKQFSIAVEGVIEAVAAWWPSSALLGLQVEDESVFRARVLGNLIEIFFADHSIDKALLLALLKTMPVWQDYGHFNDETAPVLKRFYLRLLNIGCFDVALSTYRFAKPVLLVEKARPEMLGEMARQWIDHAPHLEDIGSDAEKYKPVSVEDDASTTGAVGDPGIEDRLQSFGPDNVLGSLREFVYESKVGNVRQTIRRQEADLVDALFSACAIIDADVSAEMRAKALIQELEESIVSGPLLGHGLGHDELIQGLRKLPIEFLSDSGDAITASDIASVFDVDSWARDVTRSATMDYSLERALRPQLGSWISSASYGLLSEWLGFLRAECRGELKATGLIAIADRIARAKPDDAFKLIEESHADIKDFFFEYRDVSEAAVKLAIQIDENRGSIFALEAFRHQYMLYPTSMVHRLGAFVEILSKSLKIDGIDLYSAWALHNTRLTAGLSCREVDSSWITSVDDESFDEATVKYLLSLLRYPEVDIRLNSLNALVWLFDRRPDLIEHAKKQWPTLLIGQREYLASLFSSLALFSASNVALWAEWIVDVAQAEHHYNIRAIVSEALSSPNIRGVNSTVLEKARCLNSPPAIVIPISADVLGGQGMLGLTPYLFWAAKVIEGLAPEGGDLRRHAFRNLRSKKPDLELAASAEMAVHRRHNINSNFDTLEISGELSEAGRVSLNEALSDFVTSRDISIDHASDLAKALRLRDPSDCVSTKVGRPDKINWLSHESSDDEFLQFLDIDSVIDGALVDSDGYIRVFEYTEHRHPERYGSSSGRASISRLELFGVCNSAGSTTPGDIKNLFFKYRIRGFNQFRHELGGGSRPSTHPFVPLVTSTTRSFRSRSAPELAAPSFAFGSLYRPHPYLLDAFYAAPGGRMVCRGIEWQEAFDQGRRLHEPRSSGFLLEAGIDELIQIEKNLNVSIYACVEVRRTTEKYKPESSLKWKGRVLIVPLGRRGAMV